MYACLCVCTRVIQVCVCLCLCMRARVSVKVCTWLIGLASTVPASRPGQGDEEAAISNKRTRADRSFSVSTVSTISSGMVLMLVGVGAETDGHSVVCGLFLFALLLASRFLAAFWSRMNSASFVLRARLVALTTEWYAASSSEEEKGWDW